MGLGFLIPTIPNIPTSGGGFAKDVASIFANRRKIDKERELKRLQDEANAAMAAEVEAAQKQTQQDELDRKLAEVGDTPENREALRLYGRRGTVYGGKVYKDSGAAFAGWLENAKENLARDEFKKSGLDYDAAAGSFKSEAQKRELLRKQGMEYLKLTDASPEAQKALDDHFARLEQEANANLEALKSRFMAGGKVTGKSKQNIAWREAEISKAQQAVNDAIENRRLGSGDGSSIAAAEKQWRAGVSDAVKPLLEQYLYTNPPPDFESMNATDADLAANLEARYPNILRAGRYAPEALKAVTEQLKQNSAQGDKAARFDEKRLLQRESLRSRALDLVRQGESSYSRDAANLALKRDALEERRANNQAKIGLGYAELDTRKWIANQNNGTRRRIAIGSDKARITAALAQLGWAVDKANQWVEAVNRGDAAAAAALEANLSSGQRQSAKALYEANTSPVTVPVVLPRTVTTPGKRLWDDPKTETKYDTTATPALERLREAKDGNKGTKGDVDSFGTKKPAANPKFDFIIGPSGRWKAVPKKASK